MRYFDYRTRQRACQPSFLCANRPISVVKTDGSIAGYIHGTLGSPSGAWCDGTYMYIGGCCGYISIFDMDLNPVAHLGYFNSDLRVHGLAGNSRGDLFMFATHASPARCLARPQPSANASSRRSSADTYHNNDWLIGNQFLLYPWSGLYSEALYDAFYAKMEAAGAFDYTAAIQAQLDAWIAAR